MRRVFVIGFMGAGKSTVGALVAGELGMPFVDLDRAIEERLGASVADVFDSGGEVAFRAAESEELALVAAGPEAVVACGGGVVLDAGNRSLLTRSGLVVHLRVTPEEALARIGDTGGRPLLRDDAARNAVELLDARQALYADVADVVVDTVGKTPSEVAVTVVSALRARVGGGEA